MTETRTPSLFVLSIVLAVSCCEGQMGGVPDGGSTDGDADGDTDSDSDVDSDGDGDSDTDADSDGDVDTRPVPVAPGERTYLLDESPAGVPIWTTPATRRLAPGDRPPERTDSGLFISAARREYEPALLVLGPATGRMRVEVEPFPDLGSGGRIEVARAHFTDGWTERLEPLDSGAQVDLDGSRPVPLWLEVRVPEDARNGTHTTTLTLTPDGGSSVTIPVTLYVFDFAIPDEIHFATQMNIDIASLLGGGSVDDVKSLLFDLRMTPKSVTWPSGFRWGITWENERSTAPCEVFWDEPDEAPEYSIGSLAGRYILGEGWNGIGFPNAMIFQFVDNSTPRPGSFCGISRGDHYGSSAYNAEWSQFLTALEAYLGDNGYLDRAYYYVQNEPQNAEDERLAAHLCRVTRAAAPGLRIAISEEPKPSIAEDPDGGCGYDIWIAHIRAYEQDYAWQRQRDHGEQVWFYSLPHDPEPFFNPTLPDSEGMDMRIIPWVSWRYRATGWAYYDANIFFDGTRSNIRGRLMREGFEDYEYLYLANGGRHPRVYQDEPADPTVLSVASSLTSWSHDADSLMVLRHELGRYIEGTVDALPVLETNTDVRPRGEYFLNFQDPHGAPRADPLVVGGHTYIKIGWEPYDDENHYGWSGEHVHDPSIALYGYDEVGGYDEVQRSYVYDDWGRRNLFEFALANGRYEVTIGVGRPGAGYSDDPHNATVEGIVVVDDEVTTDAAPQIRRSVVVDLIDGSLSVEIGGRSASTGEYSYTFLAYLEIVPAS